MSESGEELSTREKIKQKLRENFDGKIVRKDLTKKIKEGANVPVYVLEFLLGQYCSSDDEEVIEKGIENVKRILADNFVRPDEAQKVLSKLRQRGSHTIIDMVTVNLNLRYDEYEASFSNLGLAGIPISEEYPEKYDRLLCGGIWWSIRRSMTACSAAASGALFSWNMIPEKKLSQILCLWTEAGSSRRGRSRRI